MSRSSENSREKTVRRRVLISGEILMKNKSRDRDRLRDQKANQNMLQRMRDMNGVYNRDKWESERITNLGYLVSISQFPESYVNALRLKGVDPLVHKPVSRPSTAPLQKKVIADKKKLPARSKTPPIQKRSISPSPPRPKTAPPSSLTSPEPLVQRSTRPMSAVPKKVAIDSKSYTLKTSKQPDRPSTAPLATSKVKIVRPSAKIVRPSTAPVTKPVIRSKARPKSAFRRSNSPTAEITISDDGSVTSAIENSSQQFSATSASTETQEEYTNSKNVRFSTENIQECTILEKISSIIQLTKSGSRVQLNQVQEKQLSMLALEIVNSVLNNDATGDLQVTADGKIKELAWDVANKVLEDTSDVVFEEDKEARLSYNQGEEKDEEEVVKNEDFENTEEIAVMTEHVEKEKTDEIVDKAEEKTEEIITTADNLEKTKDEDFEKTEEIINTAEDLEKTVEIITTAEDLEKTKDDDFEKTEEIINTAEDLEKAEEIITTAEDLEKTKDIDAKTEIDEKIQSTNNLEPAESEPIDNTEIKETETTNEVRKSRGSFKSILKATYDHFKGSKDSVDGKVEKVVVGDYNTQRAFLKSKSKANSKSSLAKSFSSDSLNGKSRKPASIKASREIIDDKSVLSSSKVSLKSANSKTGSQIL